MGVLVNNETAESDEMVRVLGPAVTAPVLARPNRSTKPRVRR